MKANLWDEDDEGLLVRLPPYLEIPWPVLKSGGAVLYFYKRAAYLTKPHPCVPQTPKLETQVKLSSKASLFKVILEIKWCYSQK